MSDIYLLIEGQQQGPYTEDQLSQSLSEGLIPSDLPARHEGLADWVPVETLLAPLQLDSTDASDGSSPSPASDDVLPQSALAFTPDSSFKSGRWYRVLVCTVSAAAIVTGLAIGVICLMKHPTHPTVSMPEKGEVAVNSEIAKSESTNGPKQIDGTDGAQLTKSASGTSPSDSSLISASIQTTGAEGSQITNSTESTNAVSPSDIEEARVFIEKQSSKNSIYRPDKKATSLRLDVDTGHLVMQNISGYEEVDCFLGSLDADYVADKLFGNTPVIILPDREHKRSIKCTIRGEVEYKEQVELAMMPEADRVANAFRFLIKAYLPNKSANNDIEQKDIRTTLCSQVRAAMLSDKTIKECEVSYDKDQESLHYRLVVLGGPYLEILMPIRKIDPQAMKWQQSGSNRSQLLFRTIDDEPAIRIFKKWLGSEKETSGSYITISFSSEDEASQCANAVTQLCKELGWQPSKF